MGKLVIGFIIPAIRFLRCFAPLTFATMFSLHQLAPLGLTTTIEAGDLVSSDLFFDSITFK